MTSSVDWTALEVRRTADAHELRIARQLHTTCYLDAGYVTEDQVTDGVVDDDWVPYSDYYIAVLPLGDGSEEIVGTCRIIRPSPRGLQTFQHAALFPENEEFFAGLPAGACMEVSSLATTRTGVENRHVSAALYALVWREAVLRGHAYLIALMDGRLLRIMKRMLNLPFEQIGPGADSFGGHVMPAAMFVPAASDNYRKDFVRQHSQGASLRELDEQIIDLRKIAELPPTAVTSQASKSQL